MEFDSRLFNAYLAKPLKRSFLFDTLVGVFDSSRIPISTATVKPTFDTQFADQHPLRILLAEDNVVNQKLALRLLEQMGYRATWHPTASKPLNHWNAKPDDDY